MELKEIKQLNITVLFSEPLNHLLIPFKDIFELFKTGDPHLDQHSFIEAPGLKVLIFINRQKEIVFEANRILIIDKSKKEPKEVEIIADLEKIFEKGLADKEKISAYGFNYDIIGLSTKIKYTDLIGSKINSIIENIKMAGIKVNFDENNSKQILEITPIGPESQFLIHLNVHYQQSLEDIEKVKEKFTRDFVNFINLVEKI